MGVRTRSVSIRTVRPFRHFPRPVLDEDDDPGRPRQLIAAILVLAALVAAGLWLTGVLRQAGEIQDCVGQGRTNCAPIR